MKRESHQLARRYRAAAGIIKLMSLLCAVFCLASAAEATSQIAQEPPATTTSIRFRMPTPPNTSDSAYYSAAARFWPALGLHVTVEPGTGAASTVQSVAAGADEMAFSDFSAAVIAIRQGAPIMIIAAPSARDANGVIFTRASGIQDWKDLAGKQIGFVPGGSSVLEARIALQRKGVDPDSVHWQTVPSGSQVALIKAGTLTVATGYSHGTDLNLNCDGIPSGSFSAYDAGIRSIGQVIIVNTNWAKRVGDRVVANALLGAIRGYILVKTNILQAEQDIKKLSPETQMNSVYDLASVDEKHGILPWTSQSMDPRHGFAWIDATHVTDAITTLESAGVLTKSEKTLPATDYFTTRYLDDPAVRAAVATFGKTKWSATPEYIRRRCGFDSMPALR